MCGLASRILLLLISKVFYSCLEILRKKDCARLHGRRLECYLSWQKVEAFHSQFERRGIEHGTFSQGNRLRIDDLAVLSVKTI